MNDVLAMNADVFMESVGLNASFFGSRGYVHFFGLCVPRGWCLHVTGLLITDKTVRCVIAFGYPPVLRIQNMAPSVHLLSDLALSRGMC